MVAFDEHREYPLVLRMLLAKTCAGPNRRMAAAVNQPGCMMDEMVMMLLNEGNAKSRVNLSTRKKRAN